MTKTPFCVRFAGVLKKTTVEPFLFLVMLGYNVRLVTLQSLLHDRSCRISLNISDFICDQLDKKEFENEQIEAVTYGNNLYNAFVMISTIPALVMATFLGPWSDRYSRKYPLILATAGIFFDSSLQVVITSIPKASPYWFLGSAIFSGFSGGLIIILSTTYSYMSDVTDERSRQTRFAILEFFTIMATPVGSFIGGQVFALGSYLTVMILGPCSFLMALLWVRFYVVETKARRFDITKKQMMQDVFKLDNMKDSYKTCSQPRAGNLRLQIWLLVAVSFSLRLINMGTLSIGFSYTRQVFKWGVTRFSYTTTLFSLLNGFATLTVVPLLNKRLLVHEAAVGLIGVLSLMAKMTLMSVAVFEGILFYGWFGGCLFACGGIAVRSRISKLVSRNELGKVFSLLATFEAATPVLGTIMMTQIYAASVSTYPGMAFMFSAFMLIPSACIFAWMMHLPTMSFTQYHEQEEKKSMKELKEVSSNVF